MINIGNFKHGGMFGGKASSEYKAWSHMKERCYNSNNPQFKDYGGRGIVVCVNWLNNFSAFLHDMGPRPAGTSLDRKNNDGNYTPDNCRWEIRSWQSTNKRGHVGVSSKYKGVHFESGRNKWSADCKIGDIRVRGGRFKTEIEAAAIYNFLAKRLHGNAAYLNDLDKGDL